MRQTPFADRVPAHGAEMIHDQFHDLCVLLAGQIRTFQENDVRRALALVIQQAVVFAHLSPEQTVASWHPAQVAHRVEGNSISLSLIRDIRSEFQPRLLEVMTDEQVLASNRWGGHLIGDAGQWSILMLRWLLLFEVMVADERRHAYRFGNVLRMRPDALLMCTPSRQPVAMAPFDVLVARDYAVLMVRDAAEIVLTAYLHANRSAMCHIKFELCVPALALTRGLAVGVMRPSAAVVRPASFCNRSQSEKIGGAGGCGRAELNKVLGLRGDGRAVRATTSLPACAGHSAPAWNMTARLLYWMSHRDDRTASVTSR